MTEWLHFHFSVSCFGEGNGIPLQFSCLENPRDWGAWWSAIYGVAQSWTRLNWLSSSSSSVTILQNLELTNPIYILTLHCLCDRIQFLFSYLFKGVLCFIGIWSLYMLCEFLLYNVKNQPDVSYMSSLLSLPWTHHSTLLGHHRAWVCSLWYTELPISHFAHGDVYISTLLPHLILHLLTHIYEICKSSPDEPVCRAGTEMQT